MSMPPLRQQKPRQNALAKLFAEAGRHLDQGDFPPAIELLERAHRLDPGDCKITLDLGHACALAYDLAAAARWFDKALQAAPEKIWVLMAIADHWSEVRDFDAAGKAYKEVLLQSTVPLGAFYGLAKIYTRQRRLDKAREIADRAMQLHGDHEGALLTGAKVCRETGQLEQAEKLLRSVLSKPGCEAEAHATALYELGGVLDQQKRYDEAMAAWLDAKAILRLTAEPATKILRAKQASMRQIQSSFSAATVERWRRAAETDLQPRRNLALLGGHARSGTTLLEYVLDAHPRIVCADESSVFQSKVYPVAFRRGGAGASYVSELDSVTPRNLRHLRTDYFRGIESFLGQTIGDRLLIDKNPALTFDIPALCRVLPETKFLVALRDPRDVCLSCFMQPAPMVPDSVPWLSLEETIKHYALTSDMWLAMKPCLGDAALVVRYEDLIEDLQASARRVLQFLGVGWDDRVLRFNEHAQTKTVRSPTYAEVTRPVFKTAMGRWRNYQKYFEPHLAHLSSTLRALGYE
ncbi:MAG: hypothetical protein DME25_03600 [Verrucomicrobia bacterium]|nr:MAG: hypothetical protein DME25_03600 [Verrucomicrobiota bacterium]